MYPFKKFSDYMYISVIINEGETAPWNALRYFQRCCSVPLSVST